MPDLAPILAILVGAFSLLGGLLGWDLLMNHRQARLLTRLVGRTGARAFYVVVGSIVVILGIVWLINGS